MFQVSLNQFYILYRLGYCRFFNITQKQKFALIHLLTKCTSVLFNFHAVSQKAVDIDGFVHVVLFKNVFEVTTGIDYCLLLSLSSLFRGEQTDLRSVCSAAGEGVNGRYTCMKTHIYTCTDTHTVTHKRTHTHTGTATHTDRDTHA